jgi:hypothetical protein
MDCATSSLGCAVTKALVPVMLRANALWSVAGKYSLVSALRARSPMNGVLSTANLSLDGIGGGAGGGGAAAAFAAGVGVDAGIGVAICGGVAVGAGAGRVVLFAVDVACGADVSSVV